MINVRLKYFLSLALICVMGGCASPPGKISDSNSMSRSLTINASVQQSIINFQEGFRQCGFRGPGVFLVTHYGEPACSPIRTDGSAVCDIYIRTYYGRSPYVHGRVELEPKMDRTIVNVFVHSIANRDEILDTWIKFLKWSPQSTCPV